MTSTTGRRAELYVRSLSADNDHRRQERVLECLEALVARDRLASCDVYVWGPGVCRQSRLAETPAGAFVRDRLDRIAAWADATGRSVEQFVRTAELRSAFTGDTRTVTRFPALALAEFDGDEDLAFFTPCRDREGVVGVDDRLRVLEGAKRASVPRSRSPPEGSA